jgi:hypothetical protein
MDLSTGWQNATFKDRLSGETTSYYFTKDRQTSLIPPPPTYYDGKDSIFLDGDDDDIREMDNLRFFLQFNCVPYLHVNSAVP